MTNFSKKEECNMLCLTSLIHDFPEQFHTAISQISQGSRSNATPEMDRGHIKMEFLFK